MSKTLKKPRRKTVGTLYHGDCLDVLRSMPDASVDAVVTDPPYLIGFMGREWDTKAAHEHLDWHRAWCDEVLRVLKPGGYMLVFGGTRTWHRLACAIEDAGFEIRDSIAWMYSSGFPKSLNVSKAIDKAAGALSHDGRGFTVAGRTDKNLPNPVVKGYVPPAPATPDAERWQGWGTALKPAFEPIVVARKPLIGTVAANVLAHGVGALNIDACRVGDEVRENPPAANKPGGAAYNMSAAGMPQDAPATTALGRWPANVVLDEWQAQILDEQNGASRYFYVAKATKKERVAVTKPDGTKIAHPTVKPLALMQWLVRLVTPPGGTVLDPFLGSGTTMQAAMYEGHACIGIEKESDYIELITTRCPDVRVTTVPTVHRRKRLKKVKR